MDREKIIRIIDELIFEAQKAPTWKAENALRCLKKELLKEQKEEISNYKEVVENLLQQLQDINKYMTPIGMVSDVRAYIEGREQPEIIRCYACKYGEKANDVYLCGNPRGFGLAHEPNWFCADGERQE